MGNYLVYLNELRLGNMFQMEITDFASTKLDEYPVSRTEYYKMDFEWTAHTFNREVANPGEYITPIALTQKILSKCGFIKIGNTWKHKNLRLKELPNGHFKLSTTMTSQEIKHIHQLQNLFFVLTGEELNVDKVEGEM
jgi:alkyl sulfatase BDS1-like metallo-beta-lactamase superfamily hydrolase